MAQTVTLSSVGTSGALILDYIGAKTTTALLTVTSTTATGAATIQFTLNSSARGETIVWAAASTATYNSTSINDSGATLTFLTPIAGLRINATAISSSSLRLTALQNAGG